MEPTLDHARIRDGHSRTVRSGPRAGIASQYEYGGTGATAIEFPTAIKSRKPDCILRTRYQEISVRRRIPAQVSEIYRDYRSQSGTPDRGSQHHTKWMADSISADQPSDRCAEA